VLRFSFALAMSSLFVLLGVAFSPRGVQAPQNPPPTAAKAPAVVELFTSEGCSSCPPADTLLAKLEELQPVQGVEVIALEEHVDYWNHDGWTDPFSSEDFTFRQERYAQVFGNSSVYTPQMIVDGQREFVGSRGHDAREAVGEAARHPRTDVAIALENAGADGSQPFAISAGKLTGATPGDTAEVWLAVTEKGLHSNVTRGENAGEDLHHASVVRTLRKIGVADATREVSFSATPSLHFEKSWKRENVRVVVFLQEKKSRRVLGAASAVAHAL